MGKKIYAIIQKFFKKKYADLMLFISIVCVLVGIYVAEQGWLGRGVGKANSIGDTLWRAFATTTTIGYGDILITHPISRMLAVVYVLLTFTLLANLLSSVSNNLFTSYQKKMAGLHTTVFVDHIVVYGPTIGSVLPLLEELCLEFGKEYDYLIILPVHSQPHEIQELIDKGYDIDFIAGKPDDEDVLIRANIMQAHSVIFLKEKMLSDQHMLGYVTNVRMLHKTVPIHCEVQHATQYRNILLNAGATKIIDIKHIHHQVMTRSISDDADLILTDIMSANGGYEMYKAAVADEWIGRTLFDLKEFYLSKEITIISLVDKNTQRLLYDNTAIISTVTDVFYVAEKRIGILGAK